MIHIKYRLNDQVVDHMFDPEDNVFITSHAFINYDGELELQTNHYTAHAYIRALLMRSVTLFRHNDGDNAMALVNAAVDIAHYAHEDLPTPLMKRVLDARNEMLARVKE